MTTQEIFAFRQQLVNPNSRKMIDFSFMIVDRIHEILEEKGMKQTDLAKLLNKKDAEISRWMRGTHNFTIETLALIQNALDAPILQIYNSNKEG